MTFAILSMMKLFINSLRQRPVANGQMPASLFLSLIVNLGRMLLSRECSYLSFDSFVDVIGRVLI